MGSATCHLYRLYQAYLLLRELMQPFEVIEAHQEPLRSKLKELLRHYPKGEHIALRPLRKDYTFIREGDPVSSVYILLSGSCSSYWDVPSKVQYMCGHSKQFDFLGDLAAMSGFPFYTCSVRTDVSSVFLVIRQDTFLRWLEQDFELYRRLARSNLRMLVIQGFSHRAADRRDNYTRVLGYLRWNYLQNAEEADALVVIKKTREGIAQEMGDISLRTLNRYLSHFAKEGVISLIRGKVSIGPEQIQRIELLIQEFDFCQTMPNDLFSSKE